MTMISGKEDEVEYHVSQQARMNKYKPYDLSLYKQGKAKSACDNKGNKARRLHQVVNRNVRSNKLQN